MQSPPNPFKLPEARHGDRVPPAVDVTQVQRLRQSAFVLPQVVQPGDCLPAGTPDAEQQLDDAGYIKLQRAVPHTRPSRWIHPRLIPVALAHLDVVGQGREVRGLMVERAAAIEALGLSRDLGGWTRLVHQRLPLTWPDWDVQLAYRVPQADMPVWRYFRDGDRAALIADLDAAPPARGAAELAAHLDRLAERSAGSDESQMGALLARLQAECLQPQPVDELMQACTRAQDRWERRVNEERMLAGLTTELAFQGYPDSFDAARRVGRRVTLFVGPPNSGKTHAAFERLTQALDGAYLAPLRLLALEGRDRLVARGVPCSLLTGEENVPAEQARVVSSTIEMVDTRREIDVAVIDEAQMIFDASRGWAWTQAIVGVPARELVIIASAYAVPALENLLRLCGEACTVRRFTRKQHVELLPGPVPLNALQKGDAVVAFSRRDVLMLRDQLGSHGHAVSVIYGALPPEVRRREAERFATGASQVLIATDAIGMGLNLPIRRVLFSTMTKFDGVGDRELTVSEVSQIAGRAGRFGLHEEGFAGVLREAEADAMKVLRELLPREPRAPRQFKAPVAPNWRHISTIGERLGLRRLEAILNVFMDQLKLDDAHFEVAELEQMIEIAAQLDDRARTLPLRERFIYAQAPVDTRTESLLQQFLGWAESHARTGRAGRPDELSDIDGHSRLDRMEQALRVCTLWLWLDLRFPGVYGHVEDIVALRSELNDGIERQLKDRRPLWQARRSRAPGRRPGRAGWR